MSYLSASNSSAKVMNAALAMIGVPEVTSFLDDSLPARTGNTMFEDVLENALSQYPWRFAQRQVNLVRLADDTPPAPWTGFYQLPKAVRVLRRVLINGVDAPSFDVFERKVALDLPASSSAKIEAVGTVMVDPDAWPGYFRLPFITFLAANICVPITQDEQLAEGLLRRAMHDLAKAASRDSQGRTQRRLDTKAFIRARRSGGRL